MRASAIAEGDLFMGEKTEISWCDATFNPWHGCAKVSPACDHCYAERNSKRFAAGTVLWGVDAARREFGDKHWDEPERWGKRMFLACSTCGWRGDAPRSTEAGKLAFFSCPKCHADARQARRRVFCASMADVFDKNAPEGARDRLWALIEATPHLDWLLLTKRIGNAAGMIPQDWYKGLPPNVWLGSTVINQEEFNRDVPKLLAMPARVRFLSIEPMLGPIDLRPALAVREVFGPPLLHWVIAGGESGPYARISNSQWFRDLRDQCAVAGVPFHFKQWGEWSAPGFSIEDATGKITDPDEAARFKIGKKAAGWLLDGVEHKAFPRSTT